MIDKIVNLINKVDSVEDMDVIMYHVRKKQAVLVNQERYRNLVKYSL